MTFLPAALALLLSTQSLPPFPQADPKIARDRRASIAELPLARARIFVAARAEQNGELLFRYVELHGANRDEFLSLLERNETYYDTAGVIGCVGDPYRVFLLWSGSHAESWFAPGCQRIMAGPGSSVPFDAALSARGSEALARLFARALAGRARRDAR